MFIVRLLVIGRIIINVSLFCGPAEFIESVMYLYQSTKDPHFLQIGVDVLTSIEYSARTECGYATVRISGAQFLNCCYFANVGWSCSGC